MVNMFELLLGFGYLLSLASGKNPFANGRGEKPFFGYVPKPEYHQNFPSGDPDSLPQNVLSYDDLLDELDWRDYDGQNFCTWSRNQHMPYYCGSCWAFSTTSCLADRYMIRRGNRFPEISIAPQVLLDCDHVDYGCHGGDAAAALNYIYNNYITDEACSAYLATGWDVGRECTDESICMNCADGCWPVPEKFYQKYGVTQYGFVSGESNMMAELSRGPIICAMYVTDEFYYDYSGGVYDNTTQFNGTDHLVSLVGYGTDDDGTDYWIGRNSWGTFWGEDGFFRIIRGYNSLNIEEACYWMEPDTSDFSNLGDYEWDRNWDSTASDEYDMTKWATKSNYARLQQERQEQKQTQKQTKTKKKRRNLSGNGVNFKTEMIESGDIEIVTNEKTGLSYMLRISNENEEDEETDDNYDNIPANWGLLHDSEPFIPVIKSPLPSEIMSEDDLPDEWSWHNVDGTNYLTLPRNQHIPVYCGSCWAFSTTSMVSDRLNIMRYQNGDDQWPEIDVSPQALINAEVAGDCDGGWPSKALEYMYEYGLPDETCQVYQAISDPHGDDSELNVCYNCDSIPGVLWPGECYEVTDYTTYYIDEYGSLENDPTGMKAEIYSRGPIACEMTATGSFWHYEGGVYSNAVNDDDTDHVITVVGWSYDENKGVEYWIGRNSWGSYWGEDGFFRIEMYDNNLNIESSCYFAVVSSDSIVSSDESDDKEEEEEEVVEEKGAFHEEMAKIALFSLM